MWILRKPSSPGEILRRFATLLATSLLVASFVTVFASSTPVWAAPAQWDGDTLTYEDNQYVRDDSANLPAGTHEGHIPFIWVDQLTIPQEAHVIYFDTDQPQSETDAELVIYDHVPPDDYGNPTDAQTIDVTNSLTGNEGDNEEYGNTCDSSITKGIGWILCPVSNWIAEGVDGLYRILNDFLEVPAVTADPDTGIYQLWSVLLAVANICFVVVFLVIIYSHLTSAGFSNYNIKTMLPRLLIAAVLVNLSFWICALAIDISNLLGHSIHSVFVNIRENMVTGADVDWSALTVFILSGGTVGAIAGFAAAAGGGGISLGFLLIAALAGVAFSVFVGFVILAARQAIITVLLILSPLAFVAFVLPSTQDLFNRWRKSFMTLLIFFPLFAVLFGGSGVAGAAIMNAADGRLHIALIGLATQFIPLVLTPLLIQFSSGLLGRIAGLANSSSRGLADRAKNWAHDNADYHAANKRAKWAAHAENGRKRRFANPAAMLGAQMDKGKRTRERGKNASEAYLDKRAEADWQNRLNTGKRRSDRQQRQRYMDTHDFAEKAKTHQESLEGRANQHWQRNLATAAPDSEYGQLRSMRTATHHANKKADTYSERMAASDQRDFDQRVISDPGYADILQAKTDTIQDTKHAQFQASEVEALGDRAYQADFEDGAEGSRKLRQQNVRIENLKKESSTVANTLQKRADADWERTSRTDARVQGMRLKETEATDSFRLAETEWNTLVENVRAQGADAPDLALVNEVAAKSLKHLVKDIAVQESALSEAKSEQVSSLAKAYKASEQGADGGALLRRAAGIGGREGEIRAYSKAWKTLVGEVTEEVETARTITGDYRREQLHTVLFEGVDPNDRTKNVTTAVRQAAMYELLQKKGNNQDAQEIRDAVAKMGLMQDDDGTYYEALRDDKGKLVLSSKGYTQMDKSKKVTNPEEIAGRRDWQQMFDDAASSSAHSMVTYSGTNKSNARSGNLVDDMRGGFYRDALGGKFSSEKIFKADIDELKTLYADMADPDGYYNSFDEGQRAKIDKTLESSILNLQADKLKNPNIDDRNRGMMNEILAKINPGYATGNHQYPVNEDKSIIPLDKRAEATDAKTFEAPATVSEPKPGQKPYYTDRDIY